MSAAPPGAAWGRAGFYAALLLWLAVHVVVAYWSPPYTDQLQIIDFGRAWWHGLESGTVNDLDAGPPVLSGFWLGPLLAYALYAASATLWLQSTVLALGLPAAAIVLRRLLRAHGLDPRAAALGALLFLLEPQLNYAAWAGRLDPWAWAALLAAALIIRSSTTSARLPVALAAGALVALSPWIWPRALLLWPLLALYGLWCLGTLVPTMAERIRLLLGWLLGAVLCTVPVALIALSRPEAIASTIEAIAVERVWQPALGAQIYFWAAVAKWSLPLYLLAGLALFRPQAWPLALAALPSALWALDGTVGGLTTYVGPLAVLLASTLLGPDQRALWPTRLIAAVLIFQASLVLVVRPLHVLGHGGDRDPARRDGLYATLNAAPSATLIDLSLDFYQPARRSRRPYSAPHYYLLQATERLPDYLARWSEAVVVEPMEPERYFRNTAEPDALARALQAAGYCPTKVLPAAEPKAARGAPVRFELHQLGGNRGYGPYRVWTPCPTAGGTAPAPPPAKARAGAGP